MSEKGEIVAQLRAVGEVADAELNLAETALLLAALDRPDASLTGYRAHLAALTEDTAALARGQDTPGGRAAALATVLFDRHGYSGDAETYDDMQNANLIRMIDRRKGLPVALGIQLLHAARTQGGRMQGLNFPGHFLLRLEHAGERLVLDPFRRARQLDAGDLRQLLKQMTGTEAELSPEHFRPVGNRDILPRLQNNIKSRALQSGDNERARAVLRSMLLLAPQHALAWRELALLEANQGQLQSALSALEHYHRHAADERARRDAATLLQHYRSQLN